MPTLCQVEDCVNAARIPSGSRIYYGGNAATPQRLLRQLGLDERIKDVELCGLLPMGTEDDLGGVFSPKSCGRIIHRVLFNSALTRGICNHGQAFYHPCHLSEIPEMLRDFWRPTVVLLQVAGPDPGGNFSLGTTAEGVLAAIETVRRHGGLVIAERNAQMPFVLGTTVPGSAIDLMVDVDHPLPTTKMVPPDNDDQRIGRMITERFIHDGSTLQFGIGRLPEVVSDAIIAKGIKELSIHTELFADAMRKLVQHGVVTNKLDAKAGEDFSTSTLFLSSSKEGYDWLNYNSSVQSRPSDYTNSIIKIAEQPNMVSVNAAIGIDLHGNVWADSLQAKKVYSGVGGQADFIRGARLSPSGVAIIALKSRTRKNIPKILEMCPAGITTTAIASDQVVIVTEHGVYEPWGLSVGERAVAIAYLAHPEDRERLLRTIVDGHHFNNITRKSNGYPKGFTPAVEILG